MAYNKEGSREQGKYNLLRFYLSMGGEMLVHHSADHYFWTIYAHFEWFWAYLVHIWDIYSLVMANMGSFGF